VRLGWALWAVSRSSFCGCGDLLVYEGDICRFSAINFKCLKNYFSIVKLGKDPHWQHDIIFKVNESESSNAAEKMERATLKK
jgi:hypothetical protein